MPVRPAVPQNSPRVVCPSNPFLFMGFRTLCQQPALATSFSSITSTLFPMRRRGEGHFPVLSLANRHSPLATVSILPRILPSRLFDEDSRPACPERSRRQRPRRVEGSLHFRSSHPHQWSYLYTGILPPLKSFVCHSYENCRGGGAFFPFWNSPLVTRPYGTASCRLKASMR